MLNKTYYKIVLPKPYPHNCGGTMFPIFRPVRLIETYMGISTGKVYARGEIMELIWQCDNCKQIVRGEK